MASGVIELTIDTLAEGFAGGAGVGTISYAELVAKFGQARADAIVSEMVSGTYGGSQWFMDFGGTEGFTGWPANYPYTSYLGGYPGSVSSTTQSALELAQNSQLAAGDTGMAAVDMGAFDLGSSTAKNAPLLGLDVGVVGAALAPIAGVALGVNLYQNNPDFWTKLSQKLLPFCYEGTTQIPSWVDVIESAINPGQYEYHTVVDKEIYDVVKQFLLDEGIGPSSSVTSSLDCGPIAKPFDVVTGPATVEVTSASGYQGFRRYTIPSGVKLVGYLRSTSPATWMPIWAADSPGKTVQATGQNTTGSSSSYTISLTSNFTYDGKTVYYNATDSGTLRAPITSNIPYYRGSAIAQNWDTNIAWTAVYGESESYYPEGTSEWTGTQGVDTAYDKDLLYLTEDENNPGTYIIKSRSGIEIAIPDYSTSTVSDPDVKPENWPDGKPYPVIIAFPWGKPTGYEGEWPETMPWPLPSTKPNWWPEILPYPQPIIISTPSTDPQVNPNPNVTNNYEYINNYFQYTLPGISVNPTTQVINNPETPPSNPTTIVNNLYIQPTQPTNPPTQSEGETPLPVLPSIPLPFSGDTIPDGLISVYHPTDAQLKSFAQWLWVTYADPSINKLWNNPFDGIIGLMEIYCTPTDVGTKTIRSGFLDSQISSAIISRYTDINCGSITVPEFYGNYLDYAPYSKCYCYLPFIGIVELDVDDIVGHAVNIKYKIDEYNGCCIARINIAKSDTIGGTDYDFSTIAYQFSGNCAVELPLSGGSQASIRGAMMQAAAYGLSSVIGGIVSGASGNIGSAISQIGYGAAHAVGSLVSAKSSVQHSGSFGSSFGALGSKKPFIIVKRPKQVIVPNYTDLYGYPSHKMVTIGGCNGYLRVREVHVESSNATDKEKVKIEALLKEGVYVN